MSSARISYTTRPHTTREEERGALQNVYKFVTDRAMKNAGGMISTNSRNVRYEKGWKDTVGAHPNQVTRIRQMFDLPEGAEASPLDSPERQYVYHCHILEHEDNDMMRPFRVVQQ